jgi:hypothetical protein
LLSASCSTLELCSSLMASARVNVVSAAREKTTPPATMLFSSSAQRCWQLRVGPVQWVALALSHARTFSDVFQVSSVVYTVVLLYLVCCTLWVAVIKHNTRISKMQRPQKWSVWLVVCTVYSLLSVMNNGRSPCISLSRPEI